MKKIFFPGLITILFQFSFAQTAMDFNMSDCNNNMHHLFTDYLDNEEVVIMEFFMECPSCVLASQSLSPMFDGLATQYPGIIHFFTIAYGNDYSCSTVSNWAGLHTPNAIPFDSGEVQVANYGGFAMPTIVVVAGSQHQVLYNSNYDEFGDTIAIKTAINNFFNPLGTYPENNFIKISTFPNPANLDLNLELTMKINSQTQIELVDLTGKLVKDIFNSYLSAGQYQFKIETINLPDGIYFIRILSNGKTWQYKVNVKH